MSTAKKVVTDETFEADVIKSDKPVLVDFWAEWCGPCKMVAPMLEEIAAEHADKLVVATLDGDANPETVRRYQVMGFPTLLLFHDGEVVRSIVGARPKRVLLRELDGVL